MSLDLYIYPYNHYSDKIHDSHTENCWCPLLVALHPPVGNHCLDVCPFLNFIRMEPYSMSSFGPGFFYCNILEIYSCCCMYPYIIFYCRIFHCINKYTKMCLSTLVIRFWSCCQFGAIRSKAAVNILDQNFFWTLCFISIG